MFSRRLALQLGAVCAAMALVTTTSAPRAAAADTVTIDWAYYNPVSLVLKQQGWLEEELKKDGIRVQWVQSLGSNKALEFLNAGSLDFGSTAGAAALLAKINGNPIETVWVYSKPEWTALVTRPDTGIAKVEDLKGKRVAVTKGTDPYIFLLRALGQHGLTASDVNLVLLQHDQGRAALERGDVDAWAGLDPMMADVELAKGYPLFFRNPDANSYGVLNVREAFAAEHPGDRRAGADGLRARPAVGAGEPGRARQDPGRGRRSCRSRWPPGSSSAPSSSARSRATRERQTILAAGQALQEAGMIKPEVDVAATVDALLQPSFASAVACRPVSTAPGWPARRRCRWRAGAGSDAAAGLCIRWLLGLLPAAAGGRGLGAGRPSGWIEARLLPPPSKVLATLVELWRTGDLRGTSRPRCGGWRLGFALGPRAGHGAGRAHRLLDPRPPDPGSTLQALRAIPSIAWVPLFILWFGIFEASKVALIATGAFFPIYLSLMAGIHAVDRKLVEVGRVYQLGPWR